MRDDAQESSDTILCWTSRCYPPQLRLNARYALHQVMVRAIERTSPSRSDRGRADFVSRLARHRLVASVPVLA